MRELRQRVIWLAISALLFIAAACLGIAVTVDQTIAGVSPSLRWIAFFSLLLFLVALICATRKLGEPDSPLPPPAVEQLSPRERLLQEYAVVNVYQRETIRFLQEVLSRPSLYVERAISEAEIQSQSIALDVTLDINLPGYMNPIALVPIMWVRKGWIPYNLRVTDGKGHIVPTLAPLEVKAILSIIAQALFAEAYIDGDLTPRTALQQIARDRLIDRIWQFSQTDVSACKTLLTFVCIQAGNSLVVRAHDDLVMLCDLIANTYLIIGEVKTGSRLVVKHSKSVSFYGSGGQRSNMPSYARLFFYGRPKRIIVPIHFAFWVANYHFRTNTEAGQYVVSHYLVDLKTHEKVTASNFTPTPYIQRAEPAGLPHTHIYIRGLDKSATPSEIGTAVEWVEVPPGVLGVATTVSIVLATLIVAFTLSEPGMLVDPNREHNMLVRGATVPGFLLTFSAVGLSWLGLTISSESLLRAPLIARVSLLLSALLSLFSAFLFLSNIQGRAYTATISFFGGHLRNSYPISWLTLSFISVVASCALIVSFVRHVYRYRKALNTPTP